MTASESATMHSRPPQCPSCSADLRPEHLDAESQRQIADLEAQVQILSDKASAAADKLADYEDELRKLKAAAAAPAAAPTPPPSSTDHHPPQQPAAVVPTNRISAFLSAASNLRRGPPSPPPDFASAAELQKERELRLQAEARLKQVTGELEELSASLFQSANEMVAEERRARSKLEERVNVLEKRDREKRERLGVLERAVERIGRVRDMLTGGGGVGD